MTGTRSRYLEVAVAALIALVAAEARAQGAGGVVILSAPSVEMALHEQVQVAAQSLYKQVDQVLHLSTLIKTARDIVQTSNEIAAFARFTKEVYDTARRYSLDDLLHDANIGLHQTFPELNRLEDQVDLALANGSALEAGPRAFFSLRDYRDQRLQGLWLRTAQRKHPTPGLAPQAGDVAVSAT